MTIGGRGDPSGVGGWLLLLSRLLIVWQPLNLAVAAMGALDAIAGSRGSRCRRPRSATYRNGRRRRCGYRALEPAGRRGDAGQSGAGSVRCDRRVRVHDALFSEQSDARRHDLLCGRIDGVPRRLAALSVPFQTCAEHILRHPVMGCLNRARCSGPTSVRSPYRRHGSAHESRRQDSSQCERWRMSCPRESPLEASEDYSLQAAGTSGR